MDKQVKLTKDEVGITLSFEESEEQKKAIFINIGEEGEFFRFDKPEEVESFIAELSQLNKLLRKSIEG